VRNAVCYQQEYYEAWRDSQPPNVQAWLKGTGFKGKDGESALLPGLSVSAASSPYPTLGLPQYTPALRVQRRSLLRRRACVSYQGLRA
jgi:hypothetical protein